jgi:SAM-dependent methyltransferase
VSDGSNGYEELAETFVRWREPRIGLAIAREWASEFGPGAEVLELGCGHGVVSQVLVDAGLKLFAVDASPSLLRRFSERFPEVKTECSTAEGSRLLGREFDGAAAIGLIFLLEEDAQRMVLEKVARGLRPGGRFLFTAPREVGEWNDDLTGRRSRSLGEARYKEILRGVGMEVKAGVVDEGENHYYFGVRGEAGS